ncbi:MAG: phosphoribosylaminoimidazolesuccinocarboxamide synthase, partial [Candidatus Aminicenantes bacterium]|nr:phosphoribosylaminoimidazolesuccinocarboxamide synthase [Candidatus Aminicenantes bacterium]
YLAGSGWKDYKETGITSGVKLPDGLKNSDRLDEPIFTPATKAEEGHDENISFKEMQKLIGSDLSNKIRDISIELYQKASLHAISKGIIIADTKFEFGLTDKEIILVDEIFTPDSSRFWPVSSYEPGRSQPSLDKQFVRDYLEGTDWDKASPPPELPSEIVNQTASRYMEIYRLLTDKDTL